MLIHTDFRAAKHIVRSFSQFEGTTQSSFNIVLIRDLVYLVIRRYKTIFICMCIFRAGHLVIIYLGIHMYVYVHI